MTTPCWNCGFEIDFDSKSLLDLIQGNLPKLQGRPPLLDSNAIVICQIEDIQESLSKYLAKFDFTGGNTASPAKIIVPCPSCKALNKDA